MYAMTSEGAIRSVGWSINFWGHKRAFLIKNALLIANSAGKLFEALLPGPWNVPFIGFIMLVELVMAVGAAPGLLLLAG